MNGRTTRAPAPAPARRAVAARDTGSATPLVLGAAALTFVVAVAVGLLGAGLRAGARARTAADLAALAAADVLVSGEPCAEAAAVASRNAARLVSCDPLDGGVVVVAETRVLSLPVRARARAVPGSVAAGVARAPPGYDRLRIGRGGPRALPIVLVHRLGRTPLLPVLRNARRRDGRRRSTRGCRRGPPGDPFTRPRGSARDR
ncbi:MAG TPA: Rv3654c family TadE-like protein [Solirubrobacteraceae bacterium]|nr:Rv3654c family TadE-like protein [Solirubrobacteraceae bacterium]